MNDPINLLKLYIYIWNLEIRIWKYDEPFWKHLGIYIIIKLIFETLILKLEYHVEQIGWPWKRNLYENHRKIFNIFIKNIFDFLIFYITKIYLDNYKFF